MNCMNRKAPPISENGRGLLSLVEISAFAVRQKHPSNEVLSFEILSSLKELMLFPNILQIVNEINDYCGRRIMFSSLSHTHGAVPRNLRR